MTQPAREHEHHTYRDYLTWPDNERWEIIDGVAYNMTPPTIAHQHILGELFVQFRNALIDKPCRVLLAPCAVLLPGGDEPEEDVDTVVEPDLLVVCDRDKIHRNFIKGAPDLVIEILSPSTGRKDQREKRKLYERAGVREYWIVSPFEHTVAVYRIGENNRYNISEFFAGDEVVQVNVLADVTIDLGTVFPTETEE